MRTKNAVKDKTGNSLKWGKLQVNTNKHEDLNLMFANHGKRMDYTVLLLQRQQKHKERLPDLFKKDAKTSSLDWRFQLIENIIVLYKDENKSSQHLYEQGNQLVSPLPNPIHSRLKETRRSMIYWKGIYNTIWSQDKSCKSCQNKRHSQKYSIALILSWS